MLEENLLDSYLDKLYNVNISMMSKRELRKEINYDLDIILRGIKGNIKDTIFSDTIVRLLLSRTVVAKEEYMMASISVEELLLLFFRELVKLREQNELGIKTYLDTANKVYGKLECLFNKHYLDTTTRKLLIEISIQFLHWCVRTFPVYGRLRSVLLTHYFTEPIFIFRYIDTMIVTDTNKLLFMLKGFFVSKVFIDYSVYSKGEPNYILMSEKELSAHLNKSGVINSLGYVNGVLKELEQNIIGYVPVYAIQRSILCTLNTANRRVNGGFNMTIGECMILRYYLQIIYHAVFSFHLKPIYVDFTYLMDLRNAIKLSYVCVNEYGVYSMSEDRTYDEIFSDLMSIYANMSYNNHLEEFGKGLLVNSLSVFARLLSGELKDLEELSRSITRDSVKSCFTSDESDRYIIENKLLALKYSKGVKACLLKTK